MAKSPPSFDLYPGDLIKSTSAMAADVFGAYFRLLCYQWEHGAIPQFTDERARVAGVDPARWDSVWARMSNRFEVIDDVGNLAQGRLHNQRAFVMQNWTFSKAKQKAKPTLEELSKIRSEAGKLGGRPHKPKSKIKQNKAKQSKWEEGSRKKEVGIGNLEAGKKEDWRLVFDHYQARHSRAKPTEERAKLTRARLAEGYSVEDLKTAIDGNHVSQYHVEGNYHDFELILRNAKQVDMFIRHKTEPAPEPAGPVTFAAQQTQNNIRAINNWLPPEEIERREQLKIEGEL